MLWYLILAAHLFLLYVLSRFVMERFFRTLHKITHSEHVSFYILSLLYLPGTVVHECAHLCMSVILFVPAEGITFIPEVLKHENGYSVRFGAVHHHKTDPIRGLLIGIAPLIAGLAIIYCVYAFQLLPHPNVWVEALSLYFLFTISSTMFTSKSDLHDAIIAIPLGLAGLFAVWALKLQPGHFFYSDSAIQAVKNMNLYLLSGSGIDAIFVAIYFLIGKLHH